MPLRNLAASQKQHEELWDGPTEMHPLDFRIGEEFLLFSISFFLLCLFLFSFEVFLIQIQTQSDYGEVI